MPRKKRNGQSPARVPSGPPEGGSLGHNTDRRLPQEFDGAMANNFPSGAPLSSSVKEQIVKSTQEMFSHLDPEVIYIVLSECDFKVENAMDSLLELSVAAEVAAPIPALVSGFERTAAALLSPREFSESRPDPGSSKSPQPLSSPSANLLTEELDLLIDQELETLTAQQGIKEEHDSSQYLSPFPPPLFPKQVLPELLQSSFDWEDETVDERQSIVDFSHLMGETPGPRSKESKMNEEPLDYIQTPWNLEAPVFSPRVHENLGPPFITPVAQKPSSWTSQPRHASLWLSHNPAGQAPLKPSATVPKAWTLPAPQLPAQYNRLRLQGRVLVLLRGAPGSGKSTMARALVEHNPGAVKLSTDDYFTCHEEYRFDPGALGDAHEWNQKRAKEAFERGANPIIIDNTNLQGWEMRPYVVQALKYGYKVLFREPDTCWRYKPRELERRTTHNVSLETIRRMLERFERFVSVQSIMSSQMPDLKQLVNSTIPISLDSSRPVSSEGPCPDLVGQHGSSEGSKKSHPQLFSSLPDVSSIGLACEVGILEGSTCRTAESLNFQPTGRVMETPERSDRGSDSDIDLVQLDSELDAKTELNHPAGDQKIPDCIVESVMNENQHWDEIPVAFSESIGQRVRREKPSKRSSLDRLEPADLVKDTNQADSKAVEKDEMKEREAEGAELVMVGGEKETPKMLDFAEDWPTEGSLEQRQVRRRERHKGRNGKEDEGVSQDASKIKTEIQLGLNKSEFQKLIDLIQTGVADIQTGFSPCSSRSLEERKQNMRIDSNRVGSITGRDNDEFEIGSKTGSLDLKSATPTIPLSALTADSLVIFKCHDGATELDTSNCAQKGREISFEGDASSELCLSPVCEGSVEVESGSYSGGTQDRKQRQGRRSGKQCKLALTFTQNCPASSLSILESHLQPPPLALVDKVCSTQTEPQDFALLWRLNHQNNVNEAVINACSQPCNVIVLSGNSSRFVPELSAAGSGAVHPSGHREVPYRVVHEKSTQVEEKELGVTQDRLENLRILSRHFKLVSFDTLEDLYDKCHQDIEWTTNLLLDSGEMFFKDEDFDRKEEDGAEDEEKQNTSSLCGALVEHVETRICPDVIEHHTELTQWSVGFEGRTQQSTFGTVDASNESSINASTLNSGGTLVPVRNKDPSDTNSHLEKSPQGRTGNEGETCGDTEVASEVDHKSGAWGGSFDDGLSIEEEIANMGEVQRLLQVELEKIEREERPERRHKQEGRCQHLDIQSVELKLPTEVALQLTELFGPVGIDPDACSVEDCAVRMDLNLSKLLHQKWKETIQEKQRQATLSFHLLQKASVNWGELHMAKARPRDWTQSAPVLNRADSYTSLHSQLEVRNQMQFMDHWNVSQPHISLRDIIMEEQALQDNMKKTRRSRADLDRRDGATLLKENQLYSLFPTIDRHFLQDIFRDHNHSLTQTELFLRSLLDEEPVKTVVAPETPRSDHHRAASKEREMVFTNTVEKQWNYQDIEDPEYEDFRAEANLQRCRQLESFSKAAEAFQQGRKEVASFYAQQGHLHGKRMREANHRAAVQIFQRVNSSLLPNNILDLHGLHVDEALEHLAQVLQDKTTACEQGLCRPQLSVITGRGNHSQGGVARIRPAVIDYLTNKHYRFTETKPGLVLVSLK
uniref:Uncharacterized protein n=1 Tax=Mola mola TaxID=94237 RepID=A0A3Q4AX51_MOLML